MGFLSQINNPIEIQIQGPISFVHTILVKCTLNTIQLKMDLLIVLTMSIRQDHKEMAFSTVVAKVQLTFSLIYAII